MKWITYMIFSYKRYIKLTVVKILRSFKLDVLKYFYAKEYIRKWPQAWVLGLEDAGYVRARP